MFKRKIYDKMLAWKKNSEGRSALLIQGARRVGKSTVAEMFAKSEYKSHVLIDFSKARPEVISLFHDMSDLDFFFLQLQMLYHVRLHERASVIIFDEVQLQPLARQAPDAYRGLLCGLRQGLRRERLRAIYPVLLGAILVIQQLRACCIDNICLAGVKLKRKDVALCKP